MIIVMEKYLNKTNKIYVINRFNFQIMQILVFFYKTLKKNNTLI